MILERTIDIRRNLWIDLNISVLKFDQKWTSLTKIIEHDYEVMTKTCGITRIISNRKSYPLWLNYYTTNKSMI